MTCSIGNGRLSTRVILPAAAPATTAAIATNATLATFACLLNRRFSAICAICAIGPINHIGVLILRAPLTVLTLNPLILLLLPQHMG